MGKGSSDIKANSILHFGPQPQVRTRDIFYDDRKTAHDLWTKLESIYTATNTQAIQNLRYQLDILPYKVNDDWDEYFSKFMNLLAQLAFHDKNSLKKKIHRN